MSTSCAPLHDLLARCRAHRSHRRADMQKQRAAAVPYAARAIFMRLIVLSLISVACMPRQEPASARQYIQVGAPEVWPPLQVLSLIDGRLEAIQLQEANNVWWGNRTGNFTQLHPGDVVLDVGANIGSFARLAANAVGPSGHVYALEPIPEVFDVLQHNTEVPKHNAVHLPRDKQPADITTIHTGITDDAEASTAKFVYFPRCTSVSTGVAFQDDADARRAAYALVLHDNMVQPLTSLQRVARFCARTPPFKWFYRPFHEVVVQLWMLGGARVLDCPVTTLNQLLDKYDIKTVHLLKVNVERAELSVLRSLDYNHWQQIQQVALHIHNKGSAIQDAKALLQSVGFKHFAVWQESRFHGASQHQMYATREKPASN